jgi:transcriptional regulator with XRE-family HTH domain
MNDAIGKRIRELRERKSWTQAALAEASGLSDREIRRIEGRKANPSAETVLAGAFNIDSSELTALAEEEPKPQAKTRLVIPRDGLEMLNAPSHSHSFAFCPEPTDDTRISALIREILDFTEYGEIWNEISPSEQYTAGQKVTMPLRELSARGWTVFVERKTTTARIPSDGKDIAIPNWTTSRLFLVSNKALSEEGKRITPDSSPQLRFGFIPEK